MSVVATHRDSAEPQDPTHESERLVRAKKLLHREVRFIHSPEFERKGAHQRILKTSTVAATRQRSEKPPKGVPRHLLHLWSIPLLTPEEEQDLFRRMNYLKYRSNALRSRLNPDRPNLRHMDDIERMLSEANDIRNHIVQANTRLVVSIARRFQYSVNAFDEMISTGNLILIKAVERFDYSLGFRFSTYATHSVQRELYRSVGKRHKRRLTEVSTAPEILLDSVEDHSDAQAWEEQDRKVEYVRSLIEKVLPEREQQVVISRFGLQSGQEKTLREVGEDMGLSQERIRQLQLRAVDWLQGAAMDDVPDSEFEAEENTAESKP